MHKRTSECGSRQGVSFNFNRADAEGSLAECFTESDAATPTRRLTSSVPLTLPLGDASLLDAGRAGSRRARMTDGIRTLLSDGHGAGAFAEESDGSRDAESIQI